MGSESRISWNMLGPRLVNMLTSLASFVSAIFLPLFADEFGASKFEIGLIGASYGVAYFFSAWIMGRQSDIRGRLPFVRIGLGTGAIALVLQSMASSSLTLMLVRALAGLCFGMVSLAIMAYNYEEGQSTGGFASLGALGWLTGTFIAIFVHDYRVLFFLSSASTSLAFAVSLFLKERERHAFIMPDVMRVVRRNVRVYLPFFLRHFGANMIWIIFPLFMVSLGANKSWIAILLSINTAGQFITMMFVERFRESRLFHAGFILTTLVFIAYALSTNYLQLIPVQALLAVAWSCFYVGALLLLLRKNEEKATAIGIFFSIMSLAEATGPFFGGLVAELLGYSALMYVAACFSIIGLAVAVAPGRAKR